ncbi:DUF935 family protein [Campylobacter sp. RM13119]|uniref:phage portal protein family protein n=1 Tax=Campylobacter californiensis TaxID=1032243 RepID=UPI001475DAE5|nr:DUF935 family protein [Campylobacter sp. RM13119]MBE3606097.1 DUF935 family protein [Campylobacter sp. RM13119]
MFNFFKNKQEPKPTRKTAVLAQNSTLIDLIINTGVRSISDADIDMILDDLTVTQCDVSRKAATEKKEIQIICENDEYKKELKKTFNPDIVSQVLETYLYGLNVFEVNYKEKDGLLYPRLIQRDFRQFKFNDDGRLMFSASGAELDIPPFKVVYGLNRANFRKVYGDALLKKLYFPVKMKNASLKFWFRFLERFGSPWAIAKTDYDPDELADEVARMLSGDSAVINKDEELELIHPSSSIDFSKMPDYLDNQISKAILGANLTSNVSNGSFAAAQTHNEIREDLASNDAKILVFVMNKVISYFKEINAITEDIEATLYDEDAPNLDRATRDKTLYDMGFKPTPRYVEARYNIELEDSIEDNKTFANSINKPKKPTLPLDKFDKALCGSDFLTSLKSQENELLKAVNSCLNECETYEEAFHKLAELFHNEPLDTLEETIFKAIANSEMFGSELDL